LWSGTERGLFLGNLRAEEGLDLRDKACPRESWWDYLSIDLAKAQVRAGACG